MENFKKDKNNEEENKLSRNLKSHHLMMISLGGTIGTGLFLASGNVISIAGPGGALVAYSIIGLMVYFLMTSLAELAAYMPVTGSFSTYATKFVDPSLGFALGWNYWYNWSITIATEISAITLIMKFWFPNTPSIIWTSLSLIIMFTLNCLSVKGFGESEYWFSIIKIIAVLVFLIIGFMMVFGIIGEKAVGFKNFVIDDAPFNGGILSIVTVFMMAGFSFQGTELLGIAAGETKDPEKNIPKAIKSIFWRILLFYIFAIFVISLLIPYNDKNLLLNDVTVSPFTLIFEKAGISNAASIMNIVILTAVLSAGNSGMYASTRMMWNLSKNKIAPRCFSKLNKRGVPLNALILTTFVASITFLSSLFNDKTIYIWLLNASSISGFIAWIGIAISHYRFRKAYIIQGKDIKDLPYKAKLYPFGPIFVFIISIIIIIGQNYSAFINKNIDLKIILFSYIGVIFFMFLYLGYKFTHKTKVIPLDKCKLK